MAMNNVNVETGIVSKLTLSRGIGNEGMNWVCTNQPAICNSGT